MTLDIDNDGLVGFAVDEATVAELGRGRKRWVRSCRQRWAGRNDRIRGERLW